MTWLWERLSPYADGKRPDGNGKSETIPETKPEEKNVEEDSKETVEVPPTKRPLEESEETGKHVISLVKRSDKKSVLDRLKRKDEAPAQSQEQANASVEGSRIISLNKKNNDIRQKESSRPLRAERPQRKFPSSRPAPVKYVKKVRSEDKKSSNTGEEAKYAHEEKTEEPKEKQKIESAEAPEEGQEEDPQPPVHDKKV